MLALDCHSKRTTLGSFDEIYLHRALRSHQHHPGPGFRRQRSAPVAATYAAPTHRSLRPPLTRSGRYNMPNHVISTPGGAPRFVPGPLRPRTQRLSWAAPSGARAHTHRQRQPSALSGCYCTSEAVDGPLQVLRGGLIERRRRVADAEDGAHLPPGRLVGRCELHIPPRICL